VSGPGWERIEDGYRCGLVVIHDNGAGVGPSSGSGRWAVEYDGKWQANIDTLKEAKNLGTILLARHS
jgi:hypothetical protein